MMQQEISTAFNKLQEGKIIIYPTDTIWGIGCDATNEEAVKKIFEIKQRTESKSLIVLMDSIQMLHRYLPTIPEVTYDIIELSEEPITIIFDNPKGLAKNVLAEDNSVAIRIPKHDFCLQLIRKFRKPIVSTSANFSGENFPKQFSEINPELLKKVDYVVNFEREKVATKSSTIIKLKENGEVTIIRK